MDMWLPDTLYRLFPPFCVVCGVMFCHLATGGWSLLLATTLINYGAFICGLRYR